MKKNLSLNFLRLLTIAVLLSVSLVGSAWLWETFSRSRRNIEEMYTTYMQEQQNMLRDQVDQALAHIVYLRSKILQQTKETVKERTDTAWMIADTLIKNHKKNVSQKELENLIRETLRHIHYPDQGYYFAINSNGVEELFADRPELEGTNMLQVQDKEGRFVVRDMLEKAQEDKTIFYQYNWTKPHQGRKIFAKIAGIRYLPAINWVIGTGMYLDDMEKQIKDNALEWLEQIRWGKEKKNYLFAGQWDGVSLTGSTKGKNILKITDPNGVHIVENLIHKAQAGGGFVEYIMPKFKNDRPAPKLSYAAPIQQWHWYVGTGRYIDEIETMIALHRQQLQKQLFRQLWQTASFLVLLSGIGLFMVLLMTRRLKKDIAPFAGFFHKAATDMVQIDEEQLNFEEFRILAHDANYMVQERNRIQKILSYQENLLSYLTSAGNQLLSGSDLDLAVKETLAILGQGCQVERVYLFEIEEQNDQSSGLLNLRFEWSKGVTSRLDDPRYQRMKYTSFKATWFQDLLAGKAIQGGPDNFSKNVAAMMREYEVQSLLMLPIIYRDNFWGMLCLDACQTSILWDSNSISSLQNFASTLCMSIMQRRSEQEAVKIRDQWITTFNSIEDAIFLIDNNRRVFNANRAALQIVGADDLSSIRDQYIQELLHEKDGQFNKRCLVDMVIEQNTHLVEEVHSILLDKIFLASVFPMYLEQGKLSGVIYIAHDITREKAIELQLAQAQKMEAIGVLAGGIAHDFNNILAAIMGFAELAGLKLQAGNVNELETDLKQILHAGGRAKDLVTQLLAFSRNQKSPKALLLVTPILKETIKMLQAFLPANIRITTELSPETGKVLADGTALHQVFMNLGNNAAHAMKEKGGELRITLAETLLNQKQQHQHSTVQNQFLHITFIDQGTGIDPLIVDKIYDPFFTTKKVDEGTGMGLAAVHGIVEGHGGFMELVNTPDRGAAFHVYLPQALNEEADNMLDEQEKQGIRPLHCGTVLVVDDEKMLLAMYKEMFEVLGCNALPCNDPGQAIELLKKNKNIDLLCTDLNMPKMNGLQLAEQCHAVIPELPVLLCSGLTVDISKEDIQRSGIDKIITKPINLQGLQDALQQLKDEQRR